MISAGETAAAFAGGSQIAQAGQALIGAVAAGWGYFIQGDIIEIQKKSAMSFYKHQDTMAFKTMAAQIKQLEKQEENTCIVQEMGKKQMKAKEEFTKATGNEMVVDRAIAEKKITNKMAAIDKEKLNDFFDARGQYTNNGNPKIKFK